MISGPVRYADHVHVVMDPRSAVSVTDPRTSPRLCVAIATRNRCDLVLKAIRSVADQMAPTDEIVIIDNASEDPTADASGDLIHELGISGVVAIESRVALSHARNTALSLATADIVIFLDDDAVAHPGWMEGYRGAWRRATPTTAAIGGAVYGEWTVPRPAWMTDTMAADVLSVGLDLSTEPTMLDQGPVGGFVWGGNMSVRRDAVASVGHYDANLGKRADAPHEGREETDLQVRLARAGWETWFHPGIAIDHLVPAQRVTKRYFLEHVRTRGRTEARTNGRQMGRSLFQTGRSGIGYLLRTARRDPRAFSSLISVSLAVSRLRG